MALLRLRTRNIWQTEIRTTFSGADLIDSEGVPELPHCTSTCVFLLVNGDKLRCGFGSEIMPPMYLWSNLRSLSTSQLTGRHTARDAQIECVQGRLSLNTVGDKCAKDNLGGIY